MKHSLAAACAFWLATASAAAAAPNNDRVEWTVSFGGGTNLGTASILDRWSLEATETFGGGFGSASFAASASARYQPSKALGGNAGVQVWLPSGLGAFAELQKQTQDQQSRLAVDASMSLRFGSFVDELVAEGRLDTERFERSDQRLHFGLGYRLRPWRDSYFELSAGASHISIRQELARELAGDSDCDALATRCTVQLSLERRESSKGSTWGLNGGVGFTKLVNKFVGLGARVRYSRGGELELPGLDAIDLDGNDYRTKVKLKTGGFAAGVNLSLRF